MTNCYDKNRLGYVLRNHSLVSRRVQFILVAQVLLTLGCGQASSDLSVASVSADDFLSSLGVDIHVDQGVPGATYIAPLRYLGVRNVRDEGRHSSQIQLIHRKPAFVSTWLARGT